MNPNTQTITGEQLKEQKAQLGHDQYDQQQAQTITSEQLKVQKAHLGQDQHDQQPQSITSEQLKVQKAHLGQDQYDQQQAQTITSEQLKVQKSHLGYDQHSQTGFEQNVRQPQSQASYPNDQRLNQSPAPNAQVLLPPDHFGQGYAQKTDVVLTGHQEKYKMENAQDVLKQLQLLFNSQDVPSGEVVDEVLNRAEQYLLKQSERQLDPETRRILEDVARLISSAQQLAKNKNLADRLQRIADETALATKEINTPGISASAQRASQRVVDVVQTWRPLIQLLLSSREFRALIVDIVQIFRNVLIRHTSIDEKQLEDQFLQGQSPVALAQNVGKDTKESFKTPGGDLQVQISDDEFDDIYEDVARVLITLSRTPTYKQGLEKIFSLYDIYYIELSQTSYTVPTNVQPHAEKAQAETQELVAAFTGRRALDNWIGSLKRLVQRANQDAKTKQYLLDLRTFILDTRTSENMSETETKARLRKFSSEGRELVYHYKYAEELNVFLDNSELLLDNIKNDEYVSVLREQAGLVADDLSYVDEQGNVKLDTEILGKLSEVIAPVIADTLKYVPIPRIEDNNKKRHFWVDNIVLCGYDVIPSKIRIQLESDSTINVRDVQTDKSQTRLILSLSNIRTELKNFDFYYHKKSFPPLTEQGKATLRLPGDGASLVMTFIVDQPSNSAIPVFHQGSADFQIHNFEVEFDKSTLKHNILVPMVTSMFKSAIKRQIENSVDANIGGLVNSIGEKLTSSLINMNRPFMQGMEKVRAVVQTSNVGQVFEKRREKLE